MSTLRSHPLSSPSHGSILSRQHLSCCFQLLPALTSVLPPPLRHDLSTSDPARRGSHPSLFCSSYCHLLLPMGCFSCPGAGICDGTFPASRPQFPCNQKGNVPWQRVLWCSLITGLCFSIRWVLSSWGHEQLLKGFITPA
ncbi:hypothetical protein HDV57DRAFT_380529 [Trichoderma longibrachiatum]|uniref:Uncharacterized protein n=1 Tax=Trichoderma longibrachiatum ATCC 18648 TaxID=983965 RepID=A0A2T4C4I0_TRILO|nr:hypothetical protein M440DRAFT_1253393 [Trichoderma longibrachiatum ATCC 18648]